MWLQVPWARADVLRSEANCKCEEVFSGMSFITSKWHPVTLYSIYKHMYNIVTTYMYVHAHVHVLQHVLVSEDGL